MTLRAVISGGGIGGIATATALAQRGWDVTVYESKPELRVSGSGIYMWSNGLSILSEIGAYDRAMRDAFIASGIDQRDQDDEILAPAMLPPGAQVLALARSELHAGLEGAARAAGVHFVTGTEVVGARSDGTLFFANGDTVSADLAIGCDGVNSPVRRSLGLEHLNQRSDEGALRVIIKATQEDLPEDSRDKCIELWNGSRRMLITPINSTEIYLALTCLEIDVDARQTNIHQCWKDSFPRFAYLLDRINPSEVLWNVYSVVKCRTWSAGRTCILGDAAHAQPPNLGQGGGMAMQNGIALAAYMANVEDPRDIPEALAAWEAAVRPLTDECQKWSCLWGELVTLPNDVRKLIFQGIQKNFWLLLKITCASTSRPIFLTDWQPNSK